MKKAVTLLSGGLDSSTSSLVAKSLGYELYALTIDYNQRHKFEIEASKKVAKFLGVKKHLIFPINLRLIGGSALTDNIDVPKNGLIPTIPITYVPARNTIFLSIALGWAEVLGAQDIFIGVNSIDYSGYPDCRPRFIATFENLANLGTKLSMEGKIKFKINAPLMFLTKTEIIKLGLKLGMDYSLTHSCYDPDENGIACGRCDACRIRLRAFKELKIKDPIKYKIEEV